MTWIAPSLLACDLGRLKEEVQALEEAGADLLHFDVMDGHFVPNITFGLPVIEAIRKYSKLPLDSHLMITNADAFIEPFANSGCNWLSVHIEACPHIQRTIQKIKECKMKAGVAINPGTSLAMLDGILSEVDYVLIMSVNPGFGGQKYIEASKLRVQELKKKIGNGKTKIEIDGGIKAENAKDVIDAGADILVVGTGLFSNPDYKSQILKLRGGGNHGTQRK